MMPHFVHQDRIKPGAAIRSGPIRAKRRPGLRENILHEILGTVAISSEEPDGRTKEFPCVRQGLGLKNGRSGTLSEKHCPPYASPRFNGERYGELREIDVGRCRSFLECTVPDARDRLRPEVNGFRTARKTRFRMRGGGRPSAFHRLVSVGARTALRGRSPLYELVGVTVTRIMEFVAGIWNPGKDADRIVVLSSAGPESGIAWAGAWNDPSPGI